MKHRPKDLLDKLATGEDKVAKVNELKEFFAKHNKSVKFRVQRRKLAGGEKLYFHIDIIGEQYKSNPYSMWQAPFHEFVVSIIVREFPKAYMTSGGTYNITIAEY